MILNHVLKIWNLLKFEVCWIYDAGTTARKIYSDGKILNIKSWMDDLSLGGNSEQYDTV